MGTAEIIIVFSALMALVALVTIGIDWIAKPLKHRRFIPRMYRFEDEKLPMDAYGHTDFNVPEADLAGQPMMGHAMGQYPMAPAHMQPMQMPLPAPMVVAQVENLHTPEQTYGSPDTVAVPATLPDELPVTSARANTSAFSDSLAMTSATAPTQPSDVDDWLATGLVPSDSIAGEATRPASSTAARSGIASTLPVPSMGAWKPGMALDETINDRKPNLATKAQRFWMSTADSLGDSHFDADNVARMHAGKAPQRVNPRTARTETMQLTGLRQATQPSEARMRWLEEAIDPWNAT